MKSSRHFASLPLLSLVVAILAACAGVDRGQYTLNFWVGASERELLRQWGTPSEIVTAGERTLIYKASRVIRMAGTPAGTQTPTDISLTCVWAFSVRSGQIIAVWTEGNDCSNAYGPAHP